MGSRVGHRYDDRNRRALRYSRHRMLSRKLPPVVTAHLGLGYRFRLEAQRFRLEGLFGEV